MTRKNESGQALVFAVLALGIVLMGFAGLGIDMGYMRYEKRLQQTAADAAAIAGANDILPGGVTEAAQNAAAANGFTVAAVNVNQCPPPAPAASVGSVSVTVNNPPCSGPHSTGLPTDGNYVEVYVAQVQPTFFMRVLGINSETVTARAVATNVGASTASGCLYTLGSSPNGISGSGTLAASTCDIIDNGDFNTAGNTLTVSSDTTGIAGSSGGGTVTCTWGTSTCPTVGVPSSGNPLYLLAPPAVGAAIPFPVNPTINPPVPGSTYNGISIANETVVFPPGRRTSWTAEIFDGIRLYRSGNRRNILFHEWRHHDCCNRRRPT